MPNYEPKMHKRRDNTLVYGAPWHYWKVCGGWTPEAQVTDDWSKVTCKNCLRSRPKTENDTLATKGEL